MFSAAFNPWMAGVASLAKNIRTTRQALPDDHPARLMETTAIADATRQIEKVRKARDAALEQMFRLMFGAWPSPADAPSEPAPTVPAAGGSSDALRARKENENA